jgi:hypothetical protein
MPDGVSLLMIQFLDWVSSRHRTYGEAMDAWRTSCPRLSVWEDALIGGLIQVQGEGPAQQLEVTLKSRGRAILEARQNQRSVPAGPAGGAEPGDPR